MTWDIGNLELEGYHERSSNPIAGHNLYEDGTWDQKKMLLNIKRKIEFIRLHDSEGFRKIPEVIWKDI